MDEEDYLADALFFSLIDLGSLPPDKSLATLAGRSSRAPPYETPMIQRCEQAWATPLESLSCEQVRLLLSQCMGLEWLGRPLLGFVTRRPAATITHYPGEMTLGCLRAARELSVVAPVELRAWLQNDFEWMEAAFAWDDEGGLRDEARDALAAARAMIRLQ